MLRKFLSHNNKPNWTLIVIQINEVLISKYTLAVYDIAYIQRMPQVGGTSWGQLDLVTVPVCY